MELIAAVVQQQEIKTNPKTPNPGSRYWIGNSGDWFDKYHWSYSSGGPGGAVIPNRTNDVYFDENSCTTSSTVTAAAGQCRKFNNNGLTNMLTINHNGYGFFVYHDLTLGPNIFLDFDQGSPTWQYFRLRGTGSHTISDTGANLSQTSLYVDAGVGTYSLATDLLLAKNYSFEGSLHIDSGTFNTLGRTLKTRNFSNNSTTNFSSSSITVSEAWSPLGTIDFGTSHVYVDGVSERFDGNGHNYYSVTFVVPCRWSGGYTELNDSNTFVNLNFEHRESTYNLPGYVSVEAGTTQSISGTFSASGYPPYELVIRCSDTGSTATLELTSDTVVDGEYLIISNSIATGSGTWYAGSSSFDGGNNSGWIFEEAP